MRLLIIRHADPDYSIDSLTEQGRIEAELLSHYMAKQDVKAFYVSPLGRARDTAEYTLKKMGRTAEVMDWLQEFPPKIQKPHKQTSGVTWDWRPKDWVYRDDFYSAENWANHPLMEDANVRQVYDDVCTQFDALLAEHGYVRNGRLYDAVRPNHDTIALFCHFGLESVLLSHLLNISPMILWHGFCAAPTSVTTIYTEEREEGIASFRVSRFGDVSHLHAVGMEPSFSARFCETYNTPGQRRD